jgi:hypothetical protein
MVRPPRSLAFFLLAPSRRVSKECRWAAVRRFLLEAPVPVSHFPSSFMKV